VTETILCIVLIILPVIAAHFLKRAWFC